jgi:serine/threonine protein kinase
VELTPEQWEQVKATFEAALKLSAAARPSFVAEACPESVVREEVVRLLTNYLEAGRFLSDPVLETPQPVSDSTEHAFRAGAILASRFKVTGFLARGGMGEVYEAEDLELHEHVALKTIRPELLSEPRALQRFKREVHVAKKVTHPNVCRVFDLFRSPISPSHAGENSLVLVSMELLRGETLAEHLERVKRMSSDEALPIAIQITSGLRAAHELGILHRDLKPGNIILLESTQGKRAVITDFGLAFHATDAGSGPPPTTSDNFGTPLYMSPEQVEGRPLTLASDIYSLGLVLYQMVTGVRAFDGDTPLSVAVRRLKEDPPRPRTLVPDLNHKCERVILKALERKPERRYQSAAELGLDLERLSQGESPLATRAWPRVFSPAQIVRQRLHALTPETFAKPSAAKRIPEFTVRLKTWEISRDHLSSILSIDEYDEHGTRISQDHGRRSSFDEELFVPPPEKEMLVTFLGLGGATGPAAQTGLVLLGSAGAGKSNLLASTFLEDRSSGNPSIFLAGRLLDTPNVEEYVSTQMARLVSPDWNLNSLCEYVRKSGKWLTLYIDAANEYCGPGGVFTLLDSIRMLVNRRDVTSTLHVVVSCRAETWRLYEDEKGIKLFDSGRLFGDTPLVLHSFDDQAQARLLFEKYSKFYALQPSSYAELSPAVIDLVRSPLMMSVVAETYSNQQVDPTVSKRIPADVDYYNVFRRLTRRKKEDARRLLSRNDPRREYLDEAIDGALQLFSRLLLSCLTTVSEAGSGRPSSKGAAVGDALSSATLTRTEEFLEYWNPPRGQDNAISTFQAIVQVGLINAISLTEYGSHDVPQRRTAYKFFHDQYTQYWLSQIYQTETLGKLDGRLANEQSLGQLADHVSTLIRQGIQVPVISGAIDHWLYRNMVTWHGQPLETGGPVDIRLVMPLLNQLAVSPSPVVDQYVSSFLTSLALRDIVTSEQLFEDVFREGNEKLRASLAGYFMECWPGASPDLLSTFLSHCEVENDAEVLKRLGGVFAYHFNRAPLAVVGYLDQALKPVDTLARALAFVFEQSPVRLGWRKEYAPQMAFLITFGTLSALANFHSEIHMSEMRAFMRRKYPWLLDVILNQPNRIKLQEETFRLGVYRRLEREGITQWDQVIGAQGNDTFFVEDNGVVQRDELYNYYKYLVATHNGDLEELDLAFGSEFRRATVAMMTYRAASAIGYIATVSLAMRLIRDSNRLEEVVTEIATGRAGVHFGALLLVDISYMDPALSHRAVDLFVKRIVPKAMDGFYPFDRAILDCVGIAAVDAGANWGVCEIAIRHVLDHMGSVLSPSALNDLGGELAKVSYFDDINAGRYVIELLLRNNYLKDPLWRPCVMKILAGMQLRNPGLLRSILEHHGEDDRTHKEVRLHASDDLKDYCDKFFYMVSWNRLIAEAIVENATLRYFLIKILMAGLAQSNSVTEYTREFRRFVIEIIRAYWGEAQDPKRYYRLTIEEALAETVAKRRIGGGKLWIPKSPRPTNRAA